jgi:uncharacterized phage protein gp47/JayE
VSTLRRLGFQEVRDNLLTSITGGVAAEPHPFPPPGGGGPPYRYSLLKPPVADITSVYGSRNRQSHLFRVGSDYQLANDGHTLVWPDGAETPDPGTVFNVNYRPRAAGSVLTDIYTGSVARTLAESVALEVARLYAQLEAVYQAGFIDSATGRSLENLVRLLDLERVRGGRAAGDVVFTRAPGSKGIISVPAGTRVMTEDGSIEYATTTTVTMSETQNAARVPARDVEPNDPVAADTLVVLPLPVAGIGAVSNPTPTAIATLDETDEELRARAKNFLHGSERGTIGAIEQALKRQGVSAEVVEVFAQAADAECAIDRVEVTPHVENMTGELMQRVVSAIHRVRPAGVKVVLQDAVAPKAVDLELRLVTGGDLLEEDRRAVQRNVQAQLTDYLARLPATDPASINRIVGLVLNNPEVEDVVLLSATLHDVDADGVDALTPVLDVAAGRLNIGVDGAGSKGFPKKLGELRITDPGLPTRLDVVIVVPAGETAPDEATVRRALTPIVTTLNNDNAVERGPGGTPPELVFDDLVTATPLPGVTPASLDPAPFSVQFAVTGETSVTRLLLEPGEVYTPAPLERLSLNAIEIRTES